MTTPKLDEARLRDAKEALEVALSQAKRGADKAGCDGWRAQEMCRQIVQLLEPAIPALLDALSAERERGDRAVGLLRRAAGIAMVDGWATREMTKSARDTVDEAHAFLATQKAEGVE